MCIFKINEFFDKKCIIFPLFFRCIKRNQRFAKMSSVKVAVRVRPFNNRETSRACSCIIEMDGPQTGMFVLNHISFLRIFPILIKVRYFICTQQTHLVQVHYVNRKKVQCITINQLEKHGQSYFSTLRTSLIHLVF